MKNSLLCLSLSTAAFFLSLEAKAFSIQERLEINRNSSPLTNLLAQQYARYSSERQCMHPLGSPIMLGMQGAAQDALVACDRALANYPNNTPSLLNDTSYVLQNRARALEVLGRFEEAIATWDRLIAIQPNRGFQSNRANAVRELQGWSGWSSWYANNPNRPLRVSDAQVRALTEALRLTLVSTNFTPGRIQDPLYTDWKQTPRRIAWLSRNCTKRVVLPEQVAANPALARSIIECAVRVTLNEEYYQSGNNEFEAVRRAASMFGHNTSNYNSFRFIAEFSQRALNFYRQLRSSSSPRR
ncbi:hypothetical protein [Microseira sp. BLCC-F43]|jgi:tetratricopeptide (TPR) repeat protein|uniref:hypothetical protein n=1 Tax=Microseira sp. BLCC-F43 TaxID=3153602 RepID=UPI0035B7A98A